MLQSCLPVQCVLSLSFSIFSELSDSILHFDVESNLVSNPAATAGNFSLPDHGDPKLTNPDLEEIPALKIATEKSGPSDDAGSKTSAAGVIMSGFGLDSLGVTSDASPDGDLDASINEVCLAEEELEQFDDEFSDIGDGDLTLTEYDIEGQSAHKDLWRENNMQAGNGEDMEDCEDVDFDPGQRSGVIGQDEGQGQAGDGCDSPALGQHVFGKNLASQSLGGKM